MEFDKKLGPCPKCGNESSRVNMYTFTQDGESMEIKCYNCGLTLHCDSEEAWAINGTHITFGQHISWNYYDNGASAIDVWNETYQKYKGE